MLRSLLLVTVLLATSLFFIGSAQATPLGGGEAAVHAAALASTHASAHASRRSIHVWNIGSWKLDRVKGDGASWLRENFGHLRSRSWSRIERHLDLGRWHDRDSGLRGKYRAKIASARDFQHKRRRAWSSSGLNITSGDPTHGSQNPVPEPTAAVVFGAGLAVVAGASRRLRR